jgi:hypothetical protein
VPRPHRESRAPIRQSLWKYTTESLQDICDEIERTRLQSELAAARNRAEDLEWRREESEEQRQRHRDEEMQRQQTWW